MANTDTKDKPVRNGTHGRYSKLTEKRKQIVLQAIREGGTQRTAAGAAGISVEALGKWIRKGRKDPDGPYGPFVRQVEAAEAEAEALLVKNIIACASPHTEQRRETITDPDGRVTKRHLETDRLGDWRAAAWALERRELERIRREQAEAGASANEEVQTTIIITHQGPARQVRIPVDDEAEADED